MYLDDASAELRPATARQRLVGRAPEQAALARLLADGRTGHGAALVLSGAAGSGKSALLDDVARQASGCRVLRARGVESEADLPYAGLHLLCAPVDDHLGRLAPPHRDALRTAAGLRPGPAHDRFGIGLGLRALLCALAEAEPVLCLVDDAQWLDRPTLRALSFVARRLTGQPVVLVIAHRRPESTRDLADLPELALEPVSDAAARALFAAAMPGRVDPVILARIVAEARGNPQALLEAVDGLSPARFAGGIECGTGRHSRPSAAAGMHAALGRLPDESRQLLGVAAADPVGDPALMWRAAALLGIPVSALEPLEAGGLIRIGARVLFARPLLRSVVYGAMSRNERRRAHGALADAGEQASAPERRAWHRLQAATVPDETAAADVVRHAPVVLERAGAAAAAAYLELAALLTPDPVRRADRSLAAAAAKLGAGDMTAATRLAELAETWTSDQPQKERARLCLAHVAAARRQSGEAVDLLLAATRRLASADPLLAREAHLDALVHALRAGRFGPTTAEDAAVDSHSAPAASRPPRAADLLLEAVSRRITKGHREAVQPVRSALAALQRPGSGAEQVRWLSVAGRLAIDLWDDRSWHAITARHLRSARASDALALLADALIDRAMVEIGAGDFAAAENLAAEAEAWAARMRLPRFSSASLVLAAWRGHEDTLAACAAAQQDASRRADGDLHTMAGYAAAVLHNGRRRYDAAMASALDAARFDEPGPGGWALVELVESATRAGRRDLAVAALERLSDRTRDAGTDWAAGIEARCRAVLATDGAAEVLYTEAIERLAQAKIATELARTRLLYGEWLRRQGRRMDARRPLRAARQSFVTMGSESFAERAQLELLATGETARRRGADTRALTPQEERVALLARDGLTNPEIGRRLFVSPRTVEYHLHKVFVKLGLSSRRELHLALADDREPPVCPA